MHHYVTQHDHHQYKKYVKCCKCMGITVCVLILVAIVLNIIVALGTASSANYSSGYYNSQYDL